MKDMLLFERCDNCNSHLTIMESVRLGDTHQLCLVVRCLTCGRHPVEEVAELK